MNIKYLGFMKFQLTLQEKDKFIESMSSDVINLLEGMEGFISRDVIGEVYDKALVSRYPVESNRKYIVKSLGIIDEEIMMMKKIPLAPFEMRYAELKIKVVSTVDKKVNAEIYKLRSEKRKQKTKHFTDSVKNKTVSIVEKIDETAEEKLGANLQQKRSTMKSFISDEKSQELIVKGITQIINMKTKK